MKNKKLAADFKKFLIGGILFSIVSIPLTWFLIDIVDLYAFTTSLIIVVSGIIIRFYLYVWMKLIKKEFMRFAANEALFSVLNVALMTLTIDFMKIPTLIAVTSVIVGLFILKFLRYLQMKLIVSAL